VRVVIAPDSFKSAVTAAQAADAMARGVAAASRDIDIDQAPMADGGEGTLDVLLDARDGQRREVETQGPLGDPFVATVGLLDRATRAVIEVAGAAGFARVPADRRDPLVTSTHGLGVVIHRAIETGADEVLLCLGGSATVDGGAGMMQALGLLLLDDLGRVIPAPIGGGDLLRIRRVVWDKPPEHLHDIRITLASDVLNPACGPNGAAAVFAPQKGADEAAVKKLEACLEHWCSLLETLSGRDLHDEPGTGAAGGIALPLLALTQAQLFPGVDLVAEAIGLPERLSDADLVITGEGCLDRQSMMGKVVGAVGRMARSADVSCVAIVGTTGPGAEDCRSVLDNYWTLDAPIEQTAHRLVNVAREVVEKCL